MYNERDIQRHQDRANAFKTLSNWWHSLGGVFLKALVVIVILDVIMLTAPSAYGRDLLLVYVILTIALLAAHIFCTFKAKMHHAKRILEEAYIAKNDYKNINNPVKNEEN